ncbi:MULTISPECIES: neutral zinc metallopeptidase [unclassified Amycolatopsis]|uniref:neutral zinc metallopeptidase n=1 Tax=unclassified Amycolatopsis TaxID=2618356 RepID=UPI002E146986|nr:MULTISPECIES: neutral zinc metallopeptidase [unclassified Amycolatopsis]WSK78777.1 neutral zinc metallopeptidase [Amycolatopsis sp. NBC_01286]
MNEAERAGPPGPPPPSPAPAARPPEPAWAPEPNPWASPGWATAPPVPIAPPRSRLWGAVGGVLVIVLAFSLVAATFPHRVDGHALVAEGVDTGRAYGGTSDGKPPKSVPELSTNPLLAAGITPGPAQCALPALGRAAEQLKAYYDALAGCLEQSWRPALAKANEPTLTAKVSVVLPEHSACGAAPSENEAVAYYCGGDTTIYAPTDWMLSDAGLNKARHIATIAHEYGHHVQRESGILSAAADKMTSPDEDSPADKEVVRRIELQANCFGSLFLAAVAGTGSISRSLANAAVADYGRADDSDTHGSRAHQLSWAKAGYDGKTTKSCDTWGAPVTEVS